MKRSFNVRTLFIIFSTLFILSSCSFPISKPSYDVGYVERGIASWYGEDFHGKPTSSGEIYNMFGLTAAHRLMPLGTVARVTNLENGRSVKVKINDRGPFVDNRIIDLSFSAAQALDMVNTGISPVEVEVLEWGPVFSDFTIQVGSFTVEQNALRLKKKLESRYQDVYIVPFVNNEKKFYRVRVGSMKEIRAAEQMVDELSAEGFVTFITRRD